MKKYLTGITFLLFTLCVPLASTASNLPKTYLFDQNHPIHSSDSDGFFSSELMSADVSKSLVLSFRKKNEPAFDLQKSKSSESINAFNPSSSQGMKPAQFYDHRNRLKVGFSLITTVLEYHYYSPDGGQRFRNLNDSENYWIAQLGIHPFWINQFYFGIKRGVVYNHLEASLGVAFSMASVYFFESPLIPTFNVGYTTLGLKSRLRFNCGIGLPEIIYVGTSLSL